MRRILTLLLIQFALIGYGQVSHSHKLRIGLGNEWNAFLSPSRLEVDDELLTKSELWDNGTYQTLALKNSLKTEGEKHRLKLKMSGSLGLYQTNQDANRYTYRLGVSYRLKYASRKYFEVAPEIFRKKRDGVNADNAVLTTPFSYTLVKAPVGFDFYLGNKAWLKTQIGYLYKNYDKSDGEKLFYKAPYFDTSISKKWVSESSTVKISLNSITQRRHYTVITRIADEDEEDDPILREGFRNWLYQFTNLILDISSNDDLQKIGIGIHHTSRIDLTRNSTFHEAGPGITYQVKSKKIALRSGIRYLIRNYTKLSPGAGNDVPLKYKYLRANVELDYELTTNALLYWRANAVNRTSNNPDLEAGNFREYFNGLIEMGVKMNL